MQTTGTSAVDTIPSAIPCAAPRLAELVVHLIDCSPRLAIAAVDAATGGAVPATTDDRLLVVAGALLSVRRSIDLRDPKAPSAPV